MISSDDYPDVATGTPDELPDAAKWLCSFQVMNGFNYSIVQGVPMVLTAKFLGAGESLVGVLLALTPFLCVLQLFAGRKADRLGFQQMMLAGRWPRYLALLALVPLPLLRGQHLWGRPIPDGLLLALLVGLVFVYTSIRSFTFIGWIPWISQVIPESRRGRYFGRDQAAVSSGMLMSLGLSAVFLGNDPQGVPPWKYAVLLGSALVAFWLGLRFLQIIPCARSAAAVSKADPGMREFLSIARKVWTHQPFRRMLVWMMINNLAWGAYGGFTVVFMRDELKIGEGSILGLAGVSMLGVIVSSMLWGRFSDAFGSRPTMRLAGGGQLAVLGLWLMAAAGVLNISVPALFVMNFIFGMICAAMTVPFLKLYMASFPLEEKTVAITLNTSITSTFAGLAPLLWGLALEWLKHQPGFAAGWLRPFTVFFGISMLLTVGMQILLSRIQRDKNLPTVEVLGRLVVDWPRQRFFGLINGLFAPGGIRPDK